MTKEELRAALPIGFELVETDGYLCAKGHGHTMPFGTDDGHPLNDLIRQHGLDLLRLQVTKWIQIGIKVARLAATKSDDEVVR